MAEQKPGETFTYGSNDSSSVFLREEEEEEEEEEAVADDDVPPEVEPEFQPLAENPDDPDNIVNLMMQAQGEEDDVMMLFMDANAFEQDSESINVQYL
jgi:hypothetical protein